MRRTAQTAAEASAAVDVSVTLPPPVRKNLDAIAGIRFGCTLWIVLEHYLCVWSYSAKEPISLLGNLVPRGQIPVEFYIVLSGFITHYAYRSKMRSLEGEEWRKQSLKYLFKRFARCFPAYYVALFLCVAFEKWSGEWESQGLTNEHIWLEATWVQAWVQFMEKEQWFGLEYDPDNLRYPRGLGGVGFNPVAWTMSTLAFCWVVYPLLALLVDGVGRRFHVAGTVLLLFACSAGAAMPYLRVFYTDPFRLNRDSEGEYGRYTSYWEIRKFPLIKLMDFAAGMALAELLMLNGGRGAKGINSWPGWRYVSDAAVLFVFFFCACRERFNGVIKAYLDDGVSVEYMETNCPGDATLPCEDFYGALDLRDDTGRYPVSHIHDETYFRVNRVKWPTGPHDWRKSYEWLFEAGFLPVIMLAIYGVCACDHWPSNWCSGGVAARVFSSEPLKSLGRDTYIVYIVHYAAYLWCMFFACKRNEGSWDGCSHALSKGDLPAYLVALWGFAFLFSRYVEGPVARWSGRFFDARAPGGWNWGLAHVVLICATSKTHIDWR
ncbi:hypothetical protein TeGR_g10207 [Tetraparma gracilis]|uniref:Acyltransferase 3 domain-containing protein n=1 Tax=Tetraparma gracilis TaxID=2962635 RepID=A0ABQ6MUN6_9STRA|nr:hypothetical protein TeGR_g10207 [Tetraparma gracilis]